jgi:hypothetical protein
MNRIFLIATLSFFFLGFLLEPAVGQSQTNAVTSPESSSSAEPRLSSRGAAEALRLAQSGVSDDVILAFIQNSRSPYNLSARDIETLKSAELSQQVLTAITNHDSTLPKAQVAAHPQTKAAGNETDSGRPAPILPRTQRNSPAPVIRDSQGSEAQPVFQGATVAPKAPPASKFETIPPYPSPNSVWSPGYWSWQDNRWEWVSGSWISRPHAGALWTNGHWTKSGNNWKWIPGSWR